MKTVVKWLLALCGTLSFGCGETQVGGMTATTRLHLSPAESTPTVVGQVRPFEVQIENLSRRKFRVASGHLVDATGGSNEQTPASTHHFTFGAALPAEVLPNESLHGTFEFEPTSSGWTHVAIRIATDELVQQETLVFSLCAVDKQGEACPSKP